MTTVHGWAGWRAALLVVVVMATAGVAHGQGRPPGGAGRRADGERVSERVMGARPAMDRLAQAVQRRLGLSDEQARQLRDATGRFATERERLFRQERVLRRDLRAELARGSAAQQDRVGKMLDDMWDLQRRRVELVGAEQKDLARFLTPVQRAEFLALQERAMRAAQQFRAQREAGQAGPPRGAPGEPLR